MLNAVNFFRQERNIVWLNVYKIVENRVSVLTIGSSSDCLEDGCWLGCIKKSERFYDRINEQNKTLRKHTYHDINDTSKHHLFIQSTTWCVTLTLLRFKRTTEPFMGIMKHHQANNNNFLIRNMSLISFWNYDQP